MIIKGFTETSLVDWDGKICAVIFLPGCDFRCPFCQNSALFLAPQSLPDILWERIEAFLKNKKGWIDGVCLTGGEPLCHPDLENLIKKIKALGFLVKLDTNGAFVDCISYLVSPSSVRLRRTAEGKRNSLLDYIAMDIKAPIDERYSKATGVKVNLENIKKSIKLIMDSGIDYEFRSTLVPTLHTEQDISDMAQAISGAKKYALQQFVPGEALDPKLRNILPYHREDFERFKKIAERYVGKCVIRGV
jgi:pyruvate formate lyase activating enzyme